MQCKSKLYIYIQIKSVADSIHELVALTQEEKLEIKNSITEIKLQKNDYWIKEGQVCLHVAYIEQ